MTLAIDLINTVHKVRGELRDDLTTPRHLATWLHDARDLLAAPLTGTDLAAIDDRDLAAARELRHALRAIATALDSGGTPGPAAVDALNATARAAVRWRELRWADPPYAEVVGAGRPVTVALAEIAQAAVDLVTGPHRADVRACGAPNCVRFFIKDHPRRAWCGPRCGNRARAARHYDRVRSTP